MDGKCHSLVFLKNTGYLTPMRTQLSFINVAKIKTLEKKISASSGIVGNATISWKVMGVCSIPVVLSNNDSLTELNLVESRSVFYADSEYAFHFSLGKPIFEKFAYSNLCKCNHFCASDWITFSRQWLMD